MRAATDLVMLPWASVVLQYQQSSDISSPPISAVLQYQRSLRRQDFPWCQHFSGVSISLVSAFLCYQRFPDVRISPAVGISLASWDMSFRIVIFYMPTAAELLLSCRCMTRTLPIQRLLQVPHENAKPRNLVRMLLCNRVPRRARPRLSSQVGAVDQPTNQR
jgi:hypothetical protein